MRASAGIQYSSQSFADEVLHTTTDAGDTVSYRKTRLERAHHLAHEFARKQMDAKVTPDLVKIHKCFKHDQHGTRKIDEKLSGWVFTKSGKVPFVALENGDILYGVVPKFSTSLFPHRKHDLLDSYHWVHYAAENNHCNHASLSMDPDLVSTVIQALSHA